MRALMGRGRLRPTERSGQGGRPWAGSPEGQRRSRTVQVPAMLRSAGKRWIDQVSAADGLEDVAEVFGQGTRHLFRAAQIQGVDDTDRT